MRTFPTDTTGRLVARHSLPQADGAAVFTGAEHSGVPVSMFLVDAPPGSGPPPHRHAYPEVFVIHEGRAIFRLGGDDLRARSGDIVIAPAGLAHAFTATGQTELHLTAIHLAARIETEWLAET